MSNSIPGRKEIHAEVTEMLGVHLANMYAFTLRLQNFHWNVEGSRFYSAHKQFEEQYKIFHSEIDDLAERIRALGDYAPASISKYHEMCLITDRKQPLDYDAMLEDLVICCIVMREHCSETVKTAALLVDEVTADMLIGHLKKIEKAIWMFRSSLSRSEKKFVDLDNTFEKEADARTFEESDYDARAETFSPELARTGGLF